MDEAARFCPGCGAPAPAAGGDSGDSDLSAGNPTAPPPSGYKTELKPSILYGRVDLENLPKGHLISDRYTIKEKIGRGGFGAVYRVYDSKFAIDKALKVLPDAVAHDRSSMEILRSETRTMGWLNHPNIIRLYDFEETGPVKYLDMEYVSGGTLADLRLAAPEKKLSEKTVRALGARIAGGLAYAHQNSVIHRDIKPDNILVAGQQQVKIMDFGISETLRTSMTRLTSVSTSGTLVYMSPEQIRGKNVGRESDIYSFGAMLYELLSGHPPFYQGAVEHQIINEPPAPIPGVSDDMNRFLQICLAKDFSDRFSDFEKIEKILAGKMPVPKPTPEPTAKPPGAKRGSGPGQPTGPSGPGVHSASDDGPPSGNGSRSRGKKIVLFVCLFLILSVLAGGGYFYLKSPASEPVPTPEAAAPVSNLKPASIPASKPETFGSLYVKTDPPVTEVWMDGKSIGQTPVQVKKIKTGEYSLTAKKKYYEDANREISIKKDIVTRLDLTLKKGKGNITIYTTPPEADVFLDGKKQPGRTPLTLSNVTAGPHSIRLERPYHEGERSVDVLPGKTARIDADLAEFGRLYVEGLPKDARVVLPDISPPYTPGMPVQTGRYTVKASADGYQTAQKTAKIAVGEDTRLDMALERITGRLYVDVIPANAKIQILDIPERFQQGMALNPGTYRVRAESKGYKTAENRVTVTAGDTRRATLTLEKSDYKGESFTNALGMEFVWIKPGTFTMGSPFSESGRDDDKRQHRVTLTKGFHMQTTEVTQGQWQAVMGSNPSHFSSCGSDCPVEQVSWNDVQEYIRKLNQKTGQTYRLPTEAEWEYACRAGTDTPFSTGNCLSTSEANYDGDYPYEGCPKGHDRKSPVKVGSFASNAWGLYDMHGNAWEWCSDWKGDYPSGHVTDPTGPSSGGYRVDRGGGWGSVARDCRSANRYYGRPGLRGFNLGFRLVLSPGQSR